MDAALYVAKVIHTDLTAANAAAWQWWTSVSAYDYKDGLVYIDKNEKGGNYYDSKMLWAFGNFSRFIRPGMKRIETSISSDKGLFVSAYTNNTTKQLVCVIVNTDGENKQLSFESKTPGRSFHKMILYKTGNNESLAKQEVTGKEITIPAKTVVTILMN